MKENRENLQQAVMGLKSNMDILRTALDKALPLLTHSKQAIADLKEMLSEVRNKPYRLVRTIDPPAESIER